MTVVGLRPNLVGVQSSSGQSAKVTLQETATGYIIRSDRKATLRERVQRGLALWAAVILGALAFALFIASAMGADPLGWGIAVVFVAAAALLFDFAMCRPDRSFRVDLIANELQELSRSRNGNLQNRGRYRLSRFSGLFIDESRGEPALVLRLDRSGRVLPVAFGSRTDLAPLATRLGRDLLEAVATAPARN